MDFGGVLGGFWEAKIHDFRTSFDVFSMQNLECNLRAQTIEKIKQNERKMSAKSRGTHRREWQTTAGGTLKSF